MSCLSLYKSSEQLLELPWEDTALQEVLEVHHRSQNM